MLREADGPVGGWRRVRPCAVLASEGWTCCMTRSFWRQIRGFKRACEAFWRLGVLVAATPRWTPNWRPSRRRMRGCWQSRGGPSRTCLRASQKSCIPDERRQVPESESPARVVLDVSPGGRGLPESAPHPDARRPGPEARRGQPREALGAVPRGPRAPTFWASRHRCG